MDKKRKATWLMMQEGGLEAERKERERLVMEEQRKMTESILKVILMVIMEQTIRNKNRWFEVMMIAR